MVAASEASISEVVPVDAKYKPLLVLLSFLSESPVTLDMLVQATIPQKIWALDGGIETFSYEGIRIVDHPINNDHITRTSLNEPIELSMVSLVANESYLINYNIREAILRFLPHELQFQWRQQALHIACAAIPWKYLHAA